MRIKYMALRKDDDTRHFGETMKGKKEWINSI